MKHELFISYSNNDKDKVDLIIAELKDHQNLKALVIANNREAGILLAEKVKNGIKNAKIIIPIITEKSISEQWINQEIGYATGLNKKIMPIIQKDLIDVLKGFIHKQVDIPYSYEKAYTIGPMSMRSRNHKKECENFMTCFRILLKDIEEKYKTPSSQSTIIYGKSQSRNSW
ncbi:MAG TPA: toll/interleukin-1 receptor domain-containing protein [Bacteroidia bacterium]|nr:toll/interleukin-1 receptor domain-containing protein [Bacteroidia bacterium]